MTSRSLIRRMLLTLLLALGFGAMHSAATSREFSKTLPLRADGSFELNNVNGTVRIEGWDREEVEVRAIKTTPDRESALDQVSIEIESRPDAVSVSTHYPQDEGVEVAVDYVIHVPRHAQLNRVPIRSATCIPSTGTSRFTRVAGTFMRIRRMATSTSN